MKYSHFDDGNFFVLPGSPVYEWKAEDFMSMYNREKVRHALNLSIHDIAVAVVGSPFSYRNVWREHAIIMQAVLPLTRKGGFSLKLLFSSVGLPSGYNRALQVKLIVFLKPSFCRPYMSCTAELCEYIYGRSWLRRLGLLTAQSLTLGVVGT